MISFIRSLLILTLVAIAVGAPQDGFAFPEDDYPDQQPIPAPSLPPTRAPTQAPTQAATRPPTATNAPTAATAAPAVTTPSPAYIQCLANCPTTNEYNPLCGSDRVTYNNPQRMDCANFCGPRVVAQWTPVSLLRRGICPPLGF